MSQAFIAYKINLNKACTKLQFIVGKTSQSSQILYLSLSLFLSFARLQHDVIKRRH